MQFITKLFTSKDEDKNNDSTKNNNDSTKNNNDSTKNNNKSTGDTNNNNHSVVNNNSMGLQPMKGTFETYDAVEVLIPWKPEEKEKSTARRPVRVVVISDTHHIQSRLRIPEGDILIHCGDFSHKSDWRNHSDHNQFPARVDKFFTWFGEQNFIHKLIIAGNHEVPFSSSVYNQKKIQEMITKYGENITYLQDSQIELFGIQFWGSPWNTSSHMGFSISRSDIDEKWELVPKNIDVFITHMPPRHFDLDLATGNYGDYFCEECKRDHRNQKHWGCKKLLKRDLKDIQPKVHCFGHVHDTPGFRVLENARQTVLVNAATEYRQKAYFFDFYPQRPFKQ